MLLGATSGKQCDFLMLSLGRLKETIRYPKVFAGGVLGRGAPGKPQVFLIVSLSDRLGGFRSIFTNSLCFRLRGLGGL